MNERAVVIVRYMYIYYHRVYCIYLYSFPRRCLHAIRKRNEQYNNNNNNDDNNNKT